MGAQRSELADIHALLHTLQHQPFGGEQARAGRTGRVSWMAAWDGMLASDAPPGNTPSVSGMFAAAADAATWRRLVAEPVAHSEGPAADQAWRVLSSVLTPLMWRNTKSVVAQEFHLPSRSLKPTWLRFQAGERAFYEQVGGRQVALAPHTHMQPRAEAPLQPCVGGSQSIWMPMHPELCAVPALPVMQVVDETRQAREALLNFRQQQEGQGRDGLGADDPTSPAAERTRKRRQAKQGERLQPAAADNLTQLRLACTHPQVRRHGYWRALLQSCLHAISITALLCRPPA
jgi:hypothetical protein